MIWLRYSLRGLRETRFRSLCVAATVVVSTLLLLVLIVGVRVLSGSGAANGRLVTVASKTAPFVTSLPIRMDAELSRLAGTDRLSPLILIAAAAGTDRMPTALQGVDVPRYLAMNPDISVDGGRERLERGDAVIGRAFAGSHGLHVDDTLVLRLVKAFLPLRSDRITLRVAGIYRETGSARNGERQILVDRRMLDEAVLATPGLVSAFLIEVPHGSSSAATCRQIDAATQATALPTVCGDQSAVLTALVGRFVDAGRVARVIGLLSTLVFFAVLVGAANELLLRDRRDHAIVQALGFSRAVAIGLSSLKWCMAAIGGLVLAALQIGGAILLLGGTSSLVAEAVMPQWTELALAVGGALAVAALAFVVALLVTGLGEGGVRGAL